MQNYEEQVLLHEFLSQQIKLNQTWDWSAGETYYFTSEDGSLKSFTPAYDIVRRERNNPEKPGVPFDFIAKPFSYGRFSKVSNILTLVVHPDRLNFKPNDQYVIKAINLYKENYNLECLKQEIKMLRRVDYLHPKKPTVIHRQVALDPRKAANETKCTTITKEPPTKAEAEHTESKAYVKMKKLPGREFYEFLNEFDGGDPLFKANMTLQILITIFKEAKTYFADKQLLHKDIQVANVLVDYRSGVLSVNIIDPGFGCSIEENCLAIKQVAAKIRALTQELKQLQKQYEDSVQTKSGDPVIKAERDAVFNELAKLLSSSLDVTYIGRVLLQAEAALQRMDEVTDAPDNLYEMKVMAKGLIVDVRHTLLKLKIGSISVICDDLNTLSEELISPTRMRIGRPKVSWEEAIQRLTKMKTQVEELQGKQPIPQIVVENRTKACMRQLEAWMHMNQYKPEQLISSDCNLGFFSTISQATTDPAKRAESTAATEALEIKFS